MKTSTFFSALLAIFFVSLNIVNAQNQNLTASTQSGLEAVNFENKTNAAASPVDVAPHYRKGTLEIDAQNAAIRLNYAVSGFAGNAVLKINDFTGRTIKSFKVNTLDAENNLFEIGDLLAGTYHYVLVVDNESKVAGQFNWNE